MNFEPVDQKFGGNKFSIFNVIENGRRKQKFKKIVSPLLFRVRNRKCEEREEDGVDPATLRLCVNVL